jgi:hypothetical protein
MALGGLIETLATPQPIDDGWGVLVDMTHRGFNVDAGVSYGGGNVGPDGQIIAAKCEAYLGKIVSGDFRVHSSLGVARFTVAEIKAMGNGLSLAGIIASAKAKLGLT